MLFIKCLNSLQQELAWHSIFLGVHQAQMWGLRGQLGQLFVEALKPIVSSLGTRVEGCLVLDPKERLGKLYDRSGCLSSGCDSSEDKGS